MRPEKIKIKKNTPEHAKHKIREENLFCEKSQAKMHDMDCITLNRINIKFFLMILVKYGDL